jgi:hypothetical protein
MAYRRGEAPPDVIADAPELREDLHPYWLAYEDLSTCRQYAGLNGVPLPIPWTAINEYAIRHRFAGEAFDDLVHIVQVMDAAFRQRAMENMPENG